MKNSYFLKLTKISSFVVRVGFPIFIAFTTHFPVLGEGEEPRDAAASFGFVDLSNMFVRIISIFILAASSALVIMIAYGIIKGSMSMGDPRGLEGAKSTWTYAVYGFLVVVLSFVIFSLVKGIVGGTSGEYGGFFGKIIEALDSLLEVGKVTSSGYTN